MVYHTAKNVYKKSIPLQSDEDLQVWGRISALCSLSQKINNDDFIKQIKSLNNKEAWQGAARVWTYPKNFQQHRELCLAGLTAGMNEENPHALAIASKISRIFSEDTPLVFLPILTLQHYFSILQNSSESSGKDVFGIDIWLNAISLHDPIYALDAAEMYLSYVRSTRSSLHDYRNNLTQLLTRLFAQAEEQEESDSGVMLQRVVTLQDMMLSLGVNGISEWLKAAERA